MVKILYLINNIKEAGAQKHLEDVLLGLDKTKFEPWLVTLKDANEIRDVKVASLNINKIYDINGVRGLMKLIKLVRKEQFGIIHSYLFSENILGAIAGKVAKVPVIITSRRDTGMLYQNKFHYFLMYRLTNIFVNKIICVSNAVKEAVISKEKANPVQIEVIYNGVDSKKFQVTGHKSQLKDSLGIKENEFVVGMIANLGWIKGHKDFIEAAGIVLKEIPNVKFLLVGSGPLLESLRSQVAGLRLEEKVLFLGTRKDIPELLSIMDVSVNASYSEGMSNTILQSMAAGVPVVATAVDGNLETVVDGVTGILVPPKDPQAMAKAIVRILKDRELARRMGESAKKTIHERFTIQIMLKNMEDLYKRLLTPKIAFIFSQFPCYDETFIMREMNQLKMEGLNFVIYSIKRNRDKIIHSEAEALVKDTYYLPLFSLRLFLINLFYLIRNPIRYLIVFCQVFFGNLKSPNFFLKTIISWMQAVGFAWRARKDRVIHVHGQWATFPATHAFIISKLNNIPFSFTGHAHDIYLDTTMLVKKMREAKFVTTCTEDNKKYLLRLVDAPVLQRSSDRLGTVPFGDSPLADKIIVNHHGVDIERFSIKKLSVPVSQCPSIFRILSVGSLLECKGFDILINACKILRDQGIDFECTIAGGGPLEKSLRSQATSFKLEEKIKFTGYITQDKLIPLYQQADVFALAMRSKIHWGIPNVLLEAMAAGSAVICTHLPSIPELIIDNKTGFIIPEENPQALVDALIRLYQNSDLRKQIASAGFEVIKEKFNIEKNAQNLIAIFNKKSRAPLNVLFVVPYLLTGGAERVVINLAKGLDRRKFNPIVCCLTTRGELAEELENNGIRVIVLGKKGKFDISVIRKLAAVIRENDIDIINTHLWGANFWGRIAAKKAGVKVIIATEHNEDVWKSGLFLMLDRWLVRSTDKIIAVSNKVKEFYVGKGIPEEKIEVIYNGVESKSLAGYESLAGSIREEFGIKKDEIVLAIIGRLVPQKGHRYLFEAVSALDGQYKVKVIVVGDGPLLRSLRSQVARLKLQEKVIFTGLRKDVKEILGITDILVMPSLREGLPMVALEAMAAGVPIIAAKVGGIPEIITDCQNGLLVDSENSKEISQAIRRLVQDRALLQKLGKNARHTFENGFTNEIMLEKTEQLYQRLYKAKVIDNA
ncbi:MAG: glycosyltransferase [Candidatus Omnitrophota bacterium]|nr:glycosyltransferase [Candidatus Omnitrophota bacterium]